MYKQILYIRKLTSHFIFFWKQGFTPLHYAAINKKKKIVTVLLSAGSDANGATKKVGIILD